jgi:hypothetical protein
MKLGKTSDSIPMAAASSFFFNIKNAVCRNIKCTNNKRCSSGIVPGAVVQSVCPQLKISLPAVICHVTMRYHRHGKICKKSLIGYPR